jgi:signal transduction histidine kinase
MGAALLLGELPFAKRESRRNVVIEVLLIAPVDDIPPGRGLHGEEGRPLMLGITRLIRIMAALFALMSLASGAPAQTNGSPHHETLRVVYTMLPPYSFFDADGAPSGFAIEVLKATAARAGFDLSYTLASNVTEALAMIADGKADLHPSLVSNAERRKIVSYTSAIRVVTLSLYALKRRAGTFQADDLSGVRVGYRVGSATDYVAKTILGASLVGFPENDSLLRALEARTIDMGVFVDAAVRRQLHMRVRGAQFAPVGAPLQATPIGIAVSKDRPGVLARLDGALRELKAEAGFNTITKRWFGPPPSWWTPQRMFFAYLAAVAVMALVALGVFRRLSERSRQMLTRETGLRADMTKRHDATLEQKNALLATQNEEMQRLLQAVSHDLKSPMVTVRGFAGVLEDALTAGDEALARDACRRIVASTGRLRGITDALQEFSRVDQKPVALRQVNLNAMVDEAREMLAVDIAAAEARIVVPEPLPKMRADESQLLRVFLNLVTNALRHGCPQPGMTIEITAAVGPNATEIRVRDHGPGIPEAFLRDVFRLFRRLAPGQSDGSGIGLSIVARIAAKHGGTAWASAPEGSGAALHVTLLNRPEDRTEDHTDDRWAAAATRDLMSEGGAA